MSVSVFDHPVLSGLLGDTETADLFSVSSDIAAMLGFEVALARAEAGEGVISPATADAIEQACRTFEPDIGSLRETTARDGVVVPGLVEQLKRRVGPEHAEAVHRGASSQDVIDSSLAQRLKAVARVADRRLDAVTAGFDRLIDAYGDHRLTGRTRMKIAVGIRVRDRVEAWRAPLVRHRQRLSEAAPRACALQFGGAAGTLAALGDKGPAVAAGIAAALDLTLPTASWHSQRDNLVEFADCLAAITGSLGKLGQDVALMAQDEIAEIELSGGGSSSIMPHKKNPVAAEVLVALARFAAVLVSAMHHALIHEQERSGTAWTLEWMALPQICLAATAALATTDRLLGSVQGIGSAK